MNFLDLVKARYSVRSFVSRPVEKDKLDYILECARLAPSAVNYQPWRFMVVESEQKKRELCQCYHNPWLAEAPLCIVVCVDGAEAWTRRADGKNHADIDASIAAEHICLAAAEQGLGTCWVCNFQPGACKSVLGLSGEVYPVAIIPVGYPKVEGKPEKTRKEMSAVVEVL